MKQKTFVLVWMLAPLGLLIGFCAAFIYMHGIAETWKSLGKPGENIVHIMGLTDGKDAIVRTDPGQVYSIELPLYSKKIGSIQWKKVNSDIPINESLDLGNTSFISPPPLFRVKEFYETDISQPEVNAHLKLALSSDGTLWIWQYKIGGIAGVTYVVYPILGFIIGLISAFFINLMRELSIRGN
jgi:hypothetical protein